MSDKISQEEYLGNFDKCTRKKALAHALDIRKFEIELYWKRATYFWAFIGATLAGYGAVQASTIPQKADLSVVLACFGIVFSFGWFCVNKGSKQWQENWENHVDMLEDDVIGPLYKIVLKRPAAVGINEHIKELITGPSPFSVSKINQIISLFVTVLWLFLLYKSLLPISMNLPINKEYVLLIGAAFASCVGFVTLGRSHEGDHRHIATKRKTNIDPEIKQDLERTINT